MLVIHFILLRKEERAYLIWQVIISIVWHWGREKPATWCSPGYWYYRP